MQNAEKNICIDRTSWGDSKIQKKEKKNGSLSYIDSIWNLKESELFILPVYGVEKFFNQVMKWNDTSEVKITILFWRRYFVQKDAWLAGSH